MRLYIIYYFSLVFIAAFILLLPVAGFYFAGEYADYAEVIHKQRNAIKKCLYGSAIHNIDFDYKVHLLRAVKPKILALGSSRVLQIRASFFSVPAITAGRAMTSITEGRAFLTEILKNPPEAVIIAADYAWFNGRDPQPDININSPAIQAAPDYPGIFSDGIKFYKWLWQGKMVFSDIMSVFDAKNCATGIAARNKKKGFGPDGSYYYTDTIIGASPNGDSGFSNSLLDVDKGIGGFKHAAAADDKSIEGFIAILDVLKKNNIHALVFFPPYASVVNARMKTLAAKYGYIDDLKYKFRQRNVKVYDYTDVSALGANDCEFVDGFHAGEVVYARILQAMSAHDPVLQRYINGPYLQKVIGENKGKAFIPDADITDRKEIDFLKLGCKKN